MIEINFNTEVREVFSQVIKVKLAEGKLVGKLKEKLQGGIAHFAFEKADGTLREAFGTLNSGLMPPQPEPKEGDKPKRVPKEGIVTYFDLEKGQFRSMRAENLILVY